MQIVRQRAYCRAGLVGNPSDGYHGKTISIIVRDFFADVILYEWERIELLLSQDDHSRFDSIQSLAQDVRLHGYYGGIRLVKATLKRFVEFCATQRELGRSGFDLHDRKFSIRYESNIPRQVGLAGSSAIIVATLRALMEFYEIEIPLHVQPSVVLNVETEELGIAAGLQDRVIQVYEGAVYMDFAPSAMQTELGHNFGTYEALDPSLLPPLFVAFSSDAGEPTEAFHNPLRALYEQGEPKIVNAMQQFADYALAARQAILDQNAQQLGELINKNFDTRRSIFQLPPRQVQLVEAARSVGASAKFAGSGGAIIGTYENEAMYELLTQNLHRLGCEVIKPQIGTSRETRV